MKLMKNLRTGKTAAYDPLLVESGNWEEVVEQKAEAPKVPMTLKLPKIKVTASLDVKPAAEQVEQTEQG